MKNCPWCGDILKVKAFDLGSTIKHVCSKCGFKIKEFIKELGPIIYPQIFPTNCNQTIYFNNSEHEVPFGVSIKARRYFYWRSL